MKCTLLLWPTDVIEHEVSIGKFGGRGKLTPSFDPKEDQ